MKNVTKQDLIDSIIKTQDPGASISNPVEFDFLGKFIKSSIDDAETVSSVIEDMDYAISVIEDMDYAIDQLQKAKAQVKEFDAQSAVS